MGPEVTLRPLATSCAKDYKGHSLVQTSFTEPPNSLNSVSWSGGVGGAGLDCFSWLYTECKTEDVSFSNLSYLVIYSLCQVIVVLHASVGNRVFSAIRRQRVSFEKRACFRVLTYCQTGNNTYLLPDWKQQGVVAPCV